jgi:hypothetical protein
MHTHSSRFLAPILGGALVTLSAQAAGKVRAGDFSTNPPTLLSLGFEWRIDGDDNRNAAVAVSYRKKGEQAWKEGLPLLRIGGERILENSLHYVTPHMFAGSIFDLEPGTDYECRFQLKDPDGVDGKAETAVTVRTRPEPMPAAGGKTYHVYPPGFNGKKEEPAFTGLLGAYYMGSSGADYFNSYPPRVKPGDIILVHGGLYKDDRYRYGGPLGTISSGTYFLTESGTPDKPIVIKAAGDGEPIFDGDGAYNLFNVMAANYNYFEGLTIRNTELAFWGGYKNLTGASGLTFKKCKFEDIGRAIYSDWSGSKDFYIADNVMTGKFPGDHLQGFTGRTWQPYNTQGPPKLVAEYAVKVYGSGHVVAYNRISGFHDGIDIATYGNPDGAPNLIRGRMPVSIDFYNNDISNVEDNCIESDGGAQNIRIFRNRCFNHGHRALSVQPMFGGPVYFIRNIVYHAPEGGAVKFTASSAGIVVYHNTFLSNLKPMLLAVSNVHYRNNLVLGKSETNETFAVETNTNYSSSDYNGFRPNEGAEYSFEWSTPPFSMMANFPETGNLSTQQQARAEAQSRETRRFQTLKEYSEATGQDRHSVLVDYDVFQKVTPPSGDPRRLYRASDFDFTLRPGSAAVDAGVRLPGINDDATGRAPDLGALEVGRPAPHYGPRE